MYKFRLLVGSMLVALVISISLPRGAASADNRNFAVHLTGDEEVPALDTLAQGQALFQLSKDGSELRYMLNVANIENVFAAHIHCGAAGVNGPVGVNLFIGSPGGGRFDGVLAKGTITAPNPANACGWITLADVVAAMNGGDTYVNVHTNDGVAPPNTGPGDFPGGEIRGQIR